MPTSDQVKELIALVEQGKFVEALEGFYDEKATMQENLAEPRAGLASLVKNERAVMRNYSEIKGQCAGPVFINGDHVVIHWVFTFATRDNRKIHLDELTLQRWNNGKVVQERFYYDPAQMR